MTNWFLCRDLSRPKAQLCDEREMENLTKTNVKQQHKETFSFKVSVNLRCGVATRNTAEPGVIQQ